MTDAEKLLADLEWWDWEIHNRMKAVALAQGHLRERERELNHAIRVKAEIAAALAKMKAKNPVDAAAVP